MSEENLLSANLYNSSLTWTGLGIKASSTLLVQFQVIDFVTDAECLLYGTTQNLKYEPAN